MSFMEKAQQLLQDSENISITENGAVGFKHTKSTLLDMNFKISSYRNMVSEMILRDWNKAIAEDEELALRWAFYVRDVRGGLGERRLFREIYKDICMSNPTLAAKLMPLIGEVYGRYDDIFVAVDTPTAGALCQYIRKVLVSDLEKRRNGESISLLAKWLPSINASSKETRKLAKRVMGYIGCNSEKIYRKTLANLRAYIDVTEVKMSAKQWKQIDYSKVPSRANLVYNAAFLRNDEARRREFLEQASQGAVKINAGILFLHDIFHKTSIYPSDNDRSLQVLWDNLPDYVQGNNTTLVVADSSGSMNTKVGNSSVTAWSVAHGFATYFAERASGQFKDKYITFSERPKFVQLRGTLSDKKRTAKEHSEVANTNIEAVFDLILDTALYHNMPQQDMPANILIMSDMEFDECNSSKGSYYSPVRFAAPDRALFNVLARRYKEYGYKLPRLIFWNICGRTNTIPITENECGVILMSGFSSAALKMVLTRELDPYKALTDVLLDERYDAVAQAYKESK